MKRLSDTSQSASEARIYNRVLKNNNYSIISTTQPEIYLKTRAKCFLLRGMYDAISTFNIFVE